MSDTLPIVECEEAGDAIYLLPQVRPVLYVPPQGFATNEEREAAEFGAVIEAYAQAARRGEVGVIRNVKEQRETE